MLIQVILKYLGINVNGVVAGGGLDGGMPALLSNYSLMVFIFSLICLFSFMNIFLYFMILIYSEKSKFILDLCNRKPWFSKIINLYKKTRISFIVIELLFFIVSITGLIGLSFYLLTIILSN